MDRNARPSDSMAQLNVQYGNDYKGRVYPYQQPIPVAQLQDKTNKRKLE
jgi:hypothetical protein